MSEIPPSNNTQSWLDRLSQAFSGEPRDREQLLILLKDARKRGLFDSNAMEMIEGVLEVSETAVDEVMVPRSQAIMIDQNASLEEVLNIMADSSHSRFPVFGDSKDEIIGILLAKDILGFLVHRKEENLLIKNFLRPVFFIPESKRLNILLKEFRSKKNHMAIVVDEYGSVAGIVTLEDVLEEIVGEIDDEHDAEALDLLISPINGSNGYQVESHISLQEINGFFGTKLFDKDVETLGGLIMQSLGHVPDRGETVILDNLRFEIIETGGGRIEKLAVFPENNTKQK